MADDGRKNAKPNGGETADQDQGRSLVAQPYGQKSQSAMNATAASWKDVMCAHAIARPRQLPPKQGLCHRLGWRKPSV